jgi:hypothetical protein
LKSLFGLKKSVTPRLTGGLFFARLFRVKKRAENVIAIAAVPEDLKS